MAPDDVRVTALEDEVVILKQKIEALTTGSDQQVGALVGMGKGMNQRLAQILCIIVNRAPGIISRNTLHTLFYGDRDDGGPEPKIFDVHICRIRKWLKREGIEGRGSIDTIWKAGYRASPELVSWVSDIYEAHGMEGIKQ